MKHRYFCFPCCAFAYIPPVILLLRGPRSAGGWSGKHQIIFCSSRRFKTIMSWTAAQEHLFSTGWIILTVILYGRVMSPIMQCFWTNTIVILVKKYVFFVKLYYVPVLKVKIYWLWTLENHTNSTDQSVDKYDDKNDIIFIIVWMYVKQSKTWQPHHSVNVGHFLVPYTWSIKWMIPTYYLLFISVSSCIWN